MNSKALKGGAFKFKLTISLSRKENNDRKGFLSFQMQTSFLARRSFQTLVRLLRELMLAHCWQIRTGDSVRWRTFRKRRILSKKLLNFGPNFDVETLPVFQSLKVVE
jgi:hypothetical protein